MPKRARTSSLPAKEKSLPLADGKEGYDDSESLIKPVVTMDIEQDTDFDEGVDPSYEIDNQICGSLFNSSMTAYIVRMMSVEVDTGRSKNGVFNKTTWSRIHRKFNRYFKADFSIEQIKAKFRRLKKDYQTFQFLKNHTGFGWDDILKVPQAPDETWEKVSRVRNNAIKFKTQTLPHYDMLNKIFGGSAATDQFACNSTQPLRHDDDEANLLTPGQGAGGISNDVSNHEAMSTSTHKSGSRNGRESCYTQAKKKGRNDVYDCAMQVISDNTIWKSEKDKAMAKVYESVRQFSTPSPPANEPKSIMETMLRLKGTHGIDPMTFTNACTNLEGLYHQRMFAVMDDDSRVEWMRFFTPREQLSSGVYKDANRGSRFGRPTNPSVSSRGYGWDGRSGNSSDNTHGRGWGDG